MMTYRIPLLVWLLLLALLGINITATLLLSGAVAWTINLASAFGMAALIMASFMGLRSADNLLRLFALGGLLWFAFLLFLTLADFLAR